MPNSVDATFQHALAAIQTGKLQEAEKLFRTVLASAPRHVASLNLLCIVLTRTGRFTEAERYAQLALKENPSSDATLYNYGAILLALNRPAEALERFSQALTLNPNLPDSWNNRGAVFNELKRYREAIADFDKAIALKPDHVAALCNKAKSLAQLKSFDEALAAFERAISLNPSLAEAHVGRGNVLVEVKRFDEARAAYDAAIALKADFADAWCGRGDVDLALHQYEASQANYEKALAFNPRLVRARLAYARICARLGRFDDALAQCDQAVALSPKSGSPWVAKGDVLLSRQDYDAALHAYATALTLEPDLAAAWLGRANVNFARQAPDLGITFFEEAAKLDSLNTVAWRGVGQASMALRQYKRAIVAFDRAFAIDPETPFLQGLRLHAMQHICDWTRVPAGVARLLADIRADKPASVPFTVLSLPSTASDQLQCARRFTDDLPSFAKLWSGQIYRHDRIRIAYLSPDFHEHPVARLIAGVFAEHDRSRFEITGVAVGPDDGSPLRQRIKNACDRFIDCRERDDGEIAQAIRDLEIDIAVDLAGHTDGNRINVFARRPAPVQVNYLGYAGTMGAGFFDYILADRVVLAEADAPFYSEQVAWLPDSFMPTDRQREIAERTPTREECGLPAGGFVFCCFNNAFKISPDIFALWLRLLKAVEGSVLWLSTATPAAMDNLRREAERQGIAAQRLIFAPRLPNIADHLARHRQADVLLDTLPYGAHATACDALWAGLPVLTCAGETFAGRVAASLLTAARLPELITTSLADYEALALRLAREPGLLAGYKSRLANNRMSCALFDTPRFTRHLEAAYVTMWQRVQSGEPPLRFAVERLPAIPQLS